MIPPGAIYAGLLTEMSDRPVEPRVRGYSRATISPDGHARFGPFGGDVTIVGCITWDKDERPVSRDEFRGSFHLMSGDTMIVTWPPPMIRLKFTLDVTL